jgi:hypothetical protein
LSEPKEWSIVGRSHHLTAQRKSVAPVVTYFVRDARPAVLGRVVDAIGQIEAKTGQRTSAQG